MAGKVEKVRKNECAECQENPQKRPLKGIGKGFFQKTNKNQLILQDLQIVIL